MLKSDILKKIKIKPYISTKHNWFQGIMVQGWYAKGKKKTLFLILWAYSLSTYTAE